MKKFGLLFLICCFSLFASQAIAEEAETDIPLELIKEFADPLTPEMAAAKEEMLYSKATTYYANYTFRIWEQRYGIYGEPSTGLPIKLYSDDTFYGEVTIGSTTYYFEGIWGTLGPDIISLEFSMGNRQWSVATFDWWSSGGWYVYDVDLGYSKRTDGSGGAAFFWSLH